MGLPRLHLFEFTDQPWLPGILRELFMEQISYVVRSLRPHDGVIPALVEVLRATGRRRIVDLCSGAGTPALLLQPALEAEVGALEILLTDKHPPLSTSSPDPAARGTVRYAEQPVDATSFTDQVPGLRTFFEGFHHFRPADARRVLQNAVDAGEPIAIVEMTERSWSSVLFTLGAALTAPFFTPFIKPFRWSRLLFTYVIPAMILISWWDATVSSLRSYSRAEMEDLVAGIRGRPYTWTFGEHRHAGVFSVWLIGSPAADRAQGEAVQDARSGKLSAGG